MYSFFYGGGKLTSMLTGLTTMFPATLFGIASYVLTALALYTVAKRRGINNAWLAWIPVVDSWILGSLSDQYRYVTRGENKCKRKVLIGLAIAVLVMSMVIGGLSVGVVISAVMHSSGHAYADMNAFVTPAIAILSLCVPLLGITIAYAVISFMALFDVYRSMDPENSTVYLVLSILFSVTKPFFLFFNRNRDLGMPPRRQAQNPADNTEA